MRRSPVRRETGSRVLRSAGFLAALSFRILPKALRFRAALLVARLLEPVIARTRAWERRAQLRTDTVRETSLDLVLMMLNRHGTTFDPILHVEGAELLESVRGMPALLVGPHTMLNILITRYVHDAGFDMLGVAADPIMISGTRIPARRGDPFGSMLLQVRREFENRKLVSAMIDRADPEPRSVVHDTPAGPMRVSDALIRLALRSNAAILFFATRLDERRRVVVTLGKPHDESVTPEEIAAEFARFAAEALPITHERQR